MIRAIFITLLVLDYGYKLLKVYLNSRQRKLPLPEAVRDIHDPVRYQTWLNYEEDCQKLHLIRITLRFAVMMVLYGTNLWTRLYFQFTVISDNREHLMIISYVLLMLLVEAPFHYIRQFRIEEKYSMNRCRFKTFLMDCIRSLLLNIIAYSGLCVAYSTPFQTWGEFLCWTCIFILTSFLIGSLLSNFFARMGNSLTPMEAGPLRDKLSELFVKEGFRLKQIYIMDASRRTTKSNALCMGIGRLKRIVLYDNLVHNYSEDEIIGVFAHEISHFKHRDPLKLTLLSVVYFLIHNLLVGVLLFMPFALSDSYGMLGFSPAFALLTVLATDVIGPVDILLKAARNAFARPMEIRADATSAEYGYGQGEISFLRKYAQKDLANLNPHPVIMSIENEHPPIHKRIEAIYAEMKHVTKK